MAENLKRAYHTVMDDHFPDRMEIAFVFGAERQTLVYEKVSWVIDGVRKGLRYGENPGQEAALYKLVNGCLTLGEVTTIAPVFPVASRMVSLASPAVRPDPVVAGVPACAPCRLNGLPMASDSAKTPAVTATLASSFEPSTVVWIVW